MEMTLVREHPIDGGGVTIFPDNEPFLCHVSWRGNLAESLGIEAFVLEQLAKAGHTVRDKSGKWLAGDVLEAGK